MIRDEMVAKGMLAVDRADFCLPSAVSLAYSDHPLDIGHHVTISAPHMHAFALQHSLPALQRPGPKRVLDVGSGSGYLTAVYAMMEGVERVVGVECVSELVEDAKRNVQKHHAQLLKSGKIVFVCGDGRKGYPDAAPYDVIHVGAAAPHVPQDVSSLAAVALSLIPDVVAGSAGARRDHGHPRGQGRGGAADAHYRKGQERKDHSAAIPGCPLRAAH